MANLTGLQIGIVISEILSCYLIWGLWQSSELLVFKISYSVIALIPFAGPFLVVFIANIPKSQAKLYKDQDRYGSDVFTRWRHVLEEKKSA